jgi:hypothetical protein
VTVPGFTGASASVPAVVVPPAATVALSEALEYPANEALTVTVPAFTFCMDQVPSEAVCAVLEPADTLAPSSGAPELFVTVPFSPPVVAAPAAIFMMLATEGTPELFRMNSM